jgi:hypothetical protein
MKKHFSDEQPIEDHRAADRRQTWTAFNAAFEIGSADFSKGPMCVRPERPADKPSPAKIA